MKKFIIKLLKMVGIFILIAVIALVATIAYITKKGDPDAYFGTQNEARNILFGGRGNTKEADNKLVKVKKMENSWRVFDFRDIEGETPDTGADPKGYPALSKYEVQDIKIYDDVGFVTGDNRREIRTSARRPMSLDEAEELMEAYLFRTIDGGKTFEKQSFGKGTAYSITRVEDIFFLLVINKAKNDSTTYISNDFGATWDEEVIPYETFINKQIRIAYKENRLDVLNITKDGGKTWQRVSSSLQKYYDFIKEKAPYLTPIVCSDKLVTLRDRKLYFFDIEADKEEIMPLNVPQRKIIDDGTLHCDKETGELSIRLFHDVVGNPRETQSSIWFPLQDKEVVFDKKLPNPVYLGVHGKHIGGFTRVEGVLTHIWTLDKGETWNYELLPNYFFEKNISYGNGEIWMEVLLRGKKGMQNGSYLAIGKIEGY
jgi:hypothetical protein